MVEFIPGLKLSELFYREAIKPVLEINFPGLPYSAALMGSGSEVLGFDTPQSTDHNWGPRQLLFLDEKDFPVYHEAMNEALSLQLPHTFYGYPTNFSGPLENGVRVIQQKVEGPVNHGVTFETVACFFEHYTGINPFRDLTSLDWLVIPEQKLLEVTAGKVFHDGLGQLEPVRQKFAYYPDEVWLLLMGAQWRRISQEEAFMGRCGDTGDDLGSRLVAGRLVRELIKLCFLLERRYAPYTKWFGTAFSRLKCSQFLYPVFEKVLGAENWKDREKHLTIAYEYIAALHNQLNITNPLEAKVSYFHERPYLVIDAGRFYEAIRQKLGELGADFTELEKAVGKIDQFVDSTDVLSHTGRCQKLQDFYLY